MDSTIQKASKGNRTALTQLYEGSKQEVYFLCRALLRNSTTTIPAAKWALKSAFQAVSRGDVQTEEAFTAYAVKQAVSYCKRSVVKKDNQAFKLPPKRNFHISQVNDRYISPQADMVENYINCLPELQRFAFVLRLTGSLDERQIAKAVGLDADSAALLKEAEQENLDKVYRVLQTKGVSYVAPSVDRLTVAFNDGVSRTHVPDELDRHVISYIGLMSDLAKETAKGKRGKYYVVSAIIVIAVAILCVVLAVGNSNDASVADGETSDTVISGNSDQTGESDEDGEGQSDDTSDSSGTSDSTDEETANVTVELDPSLTYYADIEIKDYGTITVQLDQESAPITAANFVSLAESGFYDGLTFHRIIEGFMMQGGDPNGDGTGGSDETIVGEFADNGYDNDLSHTRGAISMARSSDYDSASSQFFIVQEDSSASLDGQYAVFGYVTEGMDIVDEICKAAEPVDGNGAISDEEQPVITSVTIRTESAS